ncbi:MAG: MFS transporter [Phycisphaerae bacterium]|nr:MFS transporter [Phycisphaerae bacterium]
MSETTERSAGSIPFVRSRLSFMMFLQYAVWGIWLPILGQWLGSSVDAGGLGFNGTQIGLILGMGGACGAIAAPFIAGQVADRFLNAERALGLLLIVGGVVNLLLASTRSFTPFLWLSIAYSVAYMPTISLTNSIAFANLDNPERSFPRVRVWGTIGWIVASALFPLIWLQTEARFTPYPWFLEGTPKPEATSLIPDALRVSGAISIAYGLFSMLALPRTPPKKTAGNPFAFAEAFSLLRIPSVAVLCLAALAISMIHNVYFIRTGSWLVAQIGIPAAKVGATMSIGQMVEMGTLAILGAAIARLGYRGVLTIGALAYFGRFALFAIGSTQAPWAAYLGIALHGFCFAFFFACAFLYIDRVAPKDVRHSAQTAFGMVILGLGPILAGFYNGFLDAVGGMPAKVDDTFLGSVAAPFTAAGTWWHGVLVTAGVSMPSGQLAWNAVWWTQAAVGLGAFLLVAVAFRARVAVESPTEAPPEM